MSLPLIERTENADIRFVVSRAFIAGAKRRLNLFFSVQLEVSSTSRTSAAEGLLRTTCRDLELQRFVLPDYDPRWQDNPPPVKRSSIILKPCLRHVFGRLLYDRKAIFHESFELPKASSTALPDTWDARNSLRGRRPCSLAAERRSGFSGIFHPSSGSQSGSRGYIGDAACLRFHPLKHAALVVSDTFLSTSSPCLSLLKV